jgi:hypothetical protein
MLNQPDPRVAAYAQSRETVNPGVADVTIRSATTDGSSGESQRTHDLDPAGHLVGFQVEVSQDKNLGRAQRRSRVTNVISFLLGVLEMTLLLRFVSRLLGASQEYSFILLLYHFSQLFVAPLDTVFHDQALGVRSVFEISTLLAVLAYALLAWGLVALSCIVFASDGSRRSRR